MMYCKHCNKEFKESLEKCPLCNEHLIFVAEDEIYEDFLSKKRRAEKLVIKSRRKKINRLLDIYIATIIISVFLDINLQFIIEDYYIFNNGPRKFGPLYINIIVYTLLLYWADTKSSLISNLLFIFTMVLLLILGTKYISMPLMSSMFGGEYMYKTYWGVHALCSFITILELCYLIFDEDYYDVIEELKFEKGIISHPIVMWTCILGLVGSFITLIFIIL